MGALDQEPRRTLVRRGGSAPSGNSPAAPPRSGVREKPWLTATVSPADRGRRGHGPEDTECRGLLGESQEALLLFLEAHLPLRFPPGLHNSTVKWP